MEKSIYLKTLKLFGSKGSRFTTQDLATELGTSKRTIYSYFSTKDEIIEKTIDFVFREIILMDTEIIENSDLSLQEKIKKCFLNIPDAYNLGAIIQHMDDLGRYYPDLWNRVNNYLDSTWDSVIYLIELGIKTGEIEKVDTVILKLMLNESLKKLLDYEFIAKNQVSFDSSIESMCNLVLYGIVKRINN